LEILGIVGLSLRLGAQIRQSIISFQISESRDIFEGWKIKSIQ
jgi:hypothetical protein